MTHTPKREERDRPRPRQSRHPRTVATLTAAAALVAGVWASIGTPSEVRASNGSNAADASSAVRYDTSGGSRRVIGTVLPDLFDDDDVSQTVELPFPINFFGQSFTHLCVTENGGAFPTRNPSNSSCYEYDYGIGDLAIDAEAPMMAVLALDLDTSEYLLTSDGRDVDDLTNDFNGSTVTANLAGGVLTVNSAAHGLLAGDYVAFWDTETVLDTSGSLPVTGTNAGSFTVALPGVTDLDAGTSGLQTSVATGVWAYSNGVGAPRTVSFGTTTIDGRDAAVVTWYRVPHNDDDNPRDRSSTLQLVLIQDNTGDSTQGWDFTVEYNIGTMTDDEDGYQFDDPADDCDAWSGSTDARHTCRWGMGFASFTGGIGIQSVTISTGTAIVTTTTPHGIVQSSGGLGVRLEFPSNGGLGGLSGESVWAQVTSPTTFAVTTSAGNIATNFGSGVNMDASDVYELFATSSIGDLVDSGGTTALVTNSLNSAVRGRYRFAMSGGLVQSFAPPTMNGTPTVVDASLVDSPVETPTPSASLPPGLAPLVTQPAAPSTTATPTTTAPSTTAPTTPDTAPPTPVPAASGSLPVVTPGDSQVLENGEPVDVEVFVDNSTDLVVRSDGFELRLAGECAGACLIETAANGRQVLTLEKEGFARVQGDGFAPGTPVYVWLFSEPRYLGELTVNADGTFSGLVSLGDVELGEHTLQVNGTAANGLPRTANLGVIVNPQALPTPGAGELPSTGTSTTPLVLLALTLLGLGLVATTRRRSA